MYLSNPLIQVDSEHFGIIVGNFYTEWYLFDVRFLLIRHMCTLVSSDFYRIIYE